MPSTIRVVEVLAALSLTTDLASGLPFEKGLRTCLVGEAFGRELGLSESDFTTAQDTAVGGQWFDVYAYDV